MQAEIIEKHTLDGYAGPPKGQGSLKYVVTFLAEGKKYAFYVSEFSCSGYHLHDRGTLEFQGDRLIDFH